MQPVDRGQMTYGAGTRAQSAEVDAGLRAHMLNVYNLMALGLAFTGAIAWFTYRNAFVLGPEGNPVAYTAFGEMLYATPLFYVIASSPLVFVLVLSLNASLLV